MRWTQTAGLVLWVIVLAVSILGVDCKGVKTMTSTNAGTANTSPELERFVFRADVFDSDKIPRGLTPEIITEFVRTRIDANVAVDPLRQVEKVIDFYDAHEAAQYIKPFLDGREATAAAFLRSAVAARILAKSGTPDDIALAVRHYPKLAAQADMTSALQELIGLYAELAIRADTTPLREGIDRRIRELAAESERNRLEILELQETTLQRLERARRAGEVKRKILGMTDRTARIAEEVKMYLTLGYGYLEYLQPWAGRRLRREVWAEQPADQTKRADSAARSKELVTAFRSAIAGLDAANLTPAEVKFVRVRALRAVAFFGGQLSADEQAFLSDNAGRQLDMLSNQ